jgi:hypothetical protein
MNLEMCKAGNKINARGRDQNGEEFVRRSTEIVHSVSSRMLPPQAERQNPATQKVEFGLLDQS